MAREYFKGQENKLNELEGFLVTLESALPWLRKETEPSQAFPADRIKEVIFQTDLEGNILYLNKAWEELSGYTVEESLSTAFVKTVHPEDRERVELKMSLIHREQLEECRCQLRQLTKSKEVRWIEVNAQIRRSPSGEAIGILGTLYDFSEVKRFENLLQANIERYNLAVVGSNDGIWDWDLRRDTFEFSASWIKMFGLTPADTPTNFETWKSLIHKDDLHVLMKGVEQHLAGDTENLNTEQRVRHADGHYHWVVCKGKCIRDENGNPVRMVGRMTSIHERKLAEEERNRIFNLSPDLICVAGLDGFLKQVNPAWEDKLGWKSEELTARPWIDFIHPEEKESFLAAVLKLEAGAASISMETRFRCNEESYRWISWKVTSHLENDMVYAVGRDITDMKHTEEQLILAKEEALQSVKFKEQFLANMSHEIRTPMNAVLGFTRLLKDTNLEDDQLEYVNTINTAGQNLLVLINDILDYSKIEAGKLAIEHIDFNFRDVVFNVQKMLEPLAQEKHLDLNFKYSNALPTNFKGDPVRLTQILTNLVNNAIKFTRKGKVELEVKLIKEERTRSILQITISDTGIGIPRGQLKAIFESFTQARTDISRKYGGTGLGLTIVKKLVDLLDGSIEVESKYGKGSTFSVTLPLVTIITIQPKKEEDYIRDRYRLGQLKVLVAEDNKINQLLAKKVLDRWKFESDIVKNGLEALEAIEKKEYDVILMDVQMPEMDGYETTRKIRSDENEKTRKIPIIAMTAHAEPSQIDLCLESGMDDYISKPFYASELYDKIAQFLITERALKG